MIKKEWEVIVSIGVTKLKVSSSRDSPKKKKNNQKKKAYKRLSWMLLL